MTPEPKDRFDRAMRALVDTPAGSLWVAGLSRAHQRWPDADLVNRSVAATGSALADEGTFVDARLRFGARLLVDSRDEDGQKLLFDGTLDAAATSLIESIGRPGWTFLDAGARTGYFSLLARHLGGADATVRAFETDPISAEHITDACARSGDPEGILVVRGRCGARKGVQTGVHGQEMVITIDDHCSTYDLAPDVLRVQADGFQMQALEGARQQLRRQSFSHVILPSGWRDDRAGIERFLLGYGYTAAQVAPDGELVDLDGDPSATLCYRPA